MKQFLKRCIPFAFYSPISSLVPRVTNFGLTRYCPVCRSHLSAFVPYGPERPECECPVCKSLERHRLVWLFLTQRTDLFDARKKKLLHIAPEWSFVEVFSRLRSIDYVSADIASPLAMIRLNITALPFRDGYFDVIYCSHVLEHVPDDAAAMREIFRVLRPGGWFLPDVPILREVTFEDPTVESPEDRERLFGQFDHVRMYGKDFKTRLERSGFQVRIDGLAHSLGDARRRYFGVNDNELYFCEKELPVRQASER